MANKFKDSTWLQWFVSLTSARNGLSSGVQAHPQSSKVKIYVHRGFWQRKCSCGCHVKNPRTVLSGQRCLNVAFSSPCPLRTVASVAMNYSELASDRLDSRRFGFYVAKLAAQVGLTHWNPLAHQPADTPGTLEHVEYRQFGKLGVLALDESASLQPTDDFVNVS